MNDYVKKIIFLAGILMELSISSSFAFRPFRTEDAGASPTGVFSLELGNEFLDADDGNQNTNTASLIYGLTDWIEPAIDLVFITLLPDADDDEFGFGDVVLSAKFKILDEGGFLPAVLLKPSVSLPTGYAGKDFGLGEAELGILLVLEKTLWKITGRGNLGYFGTDLDDDYEDRYFYGIEADFPLHERLGIGYEITGGFGQSGQELVFSLIGLFFKVNERIVLDGAVEFGLNEAASGFTVIVGASFSFFQK